MGDFKVAGEEKLRTCIATIGNTVVIEAGDLVEAASGLAIKGTATGTKLAWSPFAHASGDGTQIEITVGNDFILEGDGDDVYSVADKGTLADLVVDTGVQHIDVGTASTNVFLICMEQPNAVVGAVGGIQVRIALPLF